MGSISAVFKATAYKDSVLTPANVTYTANDLLAAQAALSGCGATDTNGNFYV
jgi:hypothetical protein